MLKKYFESPLNKEEADELVNGMINGSLSVQGRSANCPFIENKLIDFPLLEKILSISRQQNHWANFGPVSRILEHYLCGALNVQDDKEIIVCKSATDALFVACNIKAIKKRKTIRWVVSAFGFFSTHIGPLAQSQVIDCNAKGLLSIEELASLPADSWDGLIVTNVFGLFDDLSDYIGLCLKSGKEIVIDNALGFYFSGRNEGAMADEVISFHQTKPWGIGEGGCLVVNKEDADLARSLINFGVGSDLDVRPYSCNSKLSDFHSALILQRLLNTYQWMPRYLEQTNRIISITADLGLALLSDIPNDKMLGHVPVICPRSISIKAAKEKIKHIQFGKYYKPLTEEMRQATALFDHILNIPCHSGIDVLSDRQIVESIRLIIE